MSRKYDWIQILYLQGESTCRTVTHEMMQQRQYELLGLQIQYYRLQNEKTMLEIDKL